MASRRFPAALTTLVLLLAVAGAPPARTASAQEVPPAPGPTVPSLADSLLGDWYGALDAGGRKVRLVLHFMKRADGRLAGTMDSPDQGASGIAMDAVSVQGARLRFTISLINGAYEGVIRADARLIRGTWTQGVSLPLDLGRGVAPEQRRPQDPVKPYPYDEEQVVVENATAGVRLAGTLTRPRGKGPFPAALLLTGSGPQDRDEALLGHRPFLVLADRLTRAGLAVLRCDDRGVGGSTGSFAGATTLDFATDARAGVEYLKGRSDVDRSRIGLVGHSEGGLIAPLVAADGGGIAFVVLLAAPGVPGDSLLGLQGAAVLHAMGETDSVVAWNGRLQRRLFAVVKAATDSSGLRQRLLETIDRSVEELPRDQRAVVNRSNMTEQAEMMSSPWFRWFVSYDPAPALARLACPVLALNGSLDMQVPSRENLPAIARALAADRNREARTLELPGLNHLFQTSPTGSPAEYGTLDETFAPAALDTIATWIEARVKRKAGRR